MYKNMPKTEFFIKLAGVLSFIWMLFVLAIVGSVFYLVYTIITKPELLANWIKVVCG